MSEHDAYRAAGQAVAASCHGAPLVRVDRRRGAVLAWGRESDAWASDSALSAIAILATGVAARERYGFGGPATSDWVILDWRFDERGLDDLEAALRLARLAAPDCDGDPYFDAWGAALDLMADETVWATVESVARRLEQASLSGDDVARIVRMERAFHSDKEAS